MSLAITRDYAFSLESGTVYRYSVGNLRNRFAIRQPSTAVSQLMATKYHLYALLDNGTVERRFHGGDGWSVYSVPANTFHISSDDERVFALSTTGVYMQDLPSNTNFSIRPRLSTLSNIIQLDHDELYSYALTNTGEIYFAGLNGSWTIYPKPLAGVVEVAAGLEFVYARDSSGSVYRSMHSGYSPWVKMGSHDDATAISVPTTHKDQLWFRHAGGIASISVGAWLKAAAATVYWVEAGWVENDWTRSVA